MFIDASAIIAILNREAGYEKLAECIEQAWLREGTKPYQIWGRCGPPGFALFAPSSQLPNALVCFRAFALAAFTT